jgi:hypothetical protein
VNTFRRDRLEELNVHPTVKPVALVTDAIKDCSRRGDIVLDPFGGSGTTVIAAQKTGRLARPPLAKLHSTGRFCSRKGTQWIHFLLNFRIM